MIKHYPKELYEKGFSKYQATGNDFIVVDYLLPDDSTSLIHFLCDRRLGIGADGFICIYPNYSDADFEMVYYNADGKKGSMCGNGGRSAVKFCLEYFKTYSRRSPVRTEVSLLANDKIYHGALHEKGYALRMTQPTPVEHLEENVYFTDTGSPHVVIVLDDAEKLQDVVYFKEITHKYRYDPRFEAGGGTNVNLCFLEGETLKMRTFERGVEDETYSCGTGTVAVTYVLAYLGTVRALYTIETKGGTLYVEWDENGKIPTLIGPAVCIFTGKLTL